MFKIAARNVMLDLETLSTSPNAAFRQIGVCRFSETEILDSESIYVDLSSLLNRGFHIDGETLRWWFGQGNEVQNEVFGELGMAVDTALGRLTSWYGMDRSQPVWSNGASFDVPIIDSAYRRLGRSVPWDYNKVRDQRTIVELAGDPPYTPKEGRKHNAHTDAVNQALRVQACWRALKQKMTQLPLTDGVGTINLDKEAQREHEQAPGTA